MPRLGPIFKLSKLKKINASSLAKFSPRNLSVFILGFAVVGSVVLSISHAASPTISKEPEQETLATSATACVDTAASNGGYVKFTTTNSAPGYNAPQDAFTSLGYINVKNAPFNADSSGGVDATAAIQNAMNVAFKCGLAVYIPSGTYLVSDTLDMHTDSYYNNAASTGTFDNVGRPAYQIIGSTAGALPIIKLQHGAAGFNAGTTPTGSNYKPVFQAWLCNDTNLTNSSTCDGNDSNQNYNQIIRNLEIDLGTNSHAVGIDMRSAEGSGAANIKIDAAGAFAGIKDLPGSGGATEDIRVDGGQYGVYATDAQPSPSITGLTLSNQTTNAIYYNGSSPLTIVGFSISGAPSPAIGGLALGGVGTGIANQEGASNLDLIDGSISFASGTGNHLIEHADRDLYLNDVYAQKYNCISWNLSGSPACDYSDSSASSWNHINEYAQSNSNGIMMVDGTFKTTVTPDIADNSSAPPNDLVSRHVATSAIPSFEDAGVKNAKADFGAVGDGVADDTAALQAALNSNGSVFLPKGTYRISATLTLKANSKFFGSSHYQSVIAPMASWIGTDQTAIGPGCGGAGTAGKTQPDGNTCTTPMVTTVDDANATTVFADIKIKLPRSDHMINGLTWRAGRNSVVRYPWILPESYNTAGSSANDPLQRTIITGHGGGRWYNKWGEVSSDTTNPDSRSLLVVDTTEPLSIYGMHGQYQHSDANNEISHATNVAIYGFKSENLTWPTGSILQINNSDNVAVFGHMSNAVMNAGLGMIDVNSSTNVLLANIARFVGGSDSITGGGNWYYVCENTCSGSTGIKAQSNAVLFKRGNYQAP